MQQQNNSAHHRKGETNSAAEFLLSFGVVTLIITTLAGSLSYWEEGYFDIFPASRYGILVPLLLIIAAVVTARFRLRTLRFNEHGFACGLIVLFFSDWLTRSYNLLQGPMIRGEIIVGAIATLLLLRQKHISAFRYILPLTIALLVACFFVESRGRLLFSDDNPTFLYRLMLLKENFPSIPFYNPLWNYGIESRDFFATGSLNVFFIFWPLIYLFDILSIYNILVVLILFAFLPAAVWLAARLAGLRSPATAISAVLALTSSLLWYRWALKYGTLGFITSASLLPLNISIAARLLAGNIDLRKREVLLMALSFSLMLLWSPSALAFIPLIPLALLRSPRLLRTPRFLTLAILITLLNLPWMLVFWRVSNVGNFIKTEKPSYSTMAALEKASSSEDEKEKPTIEVINTKSRVGTFESLTALKIVRENSVSTNPLLVFLALPGLFFLPAAIRLPFFLSSAWLLLLGIVASQLKPQLELDRMIILFYLCLSVPVAGTIERVLRRGLLPGVANILPALAIGGYFLTAPFSTATILLNRSIERYYFARKELHSLVDTIVTHSKDGRSLFSGFVLHDLYHGHLAPLATLSKRPLIASSPFHDQWKYKEVFPTEVINAGDSAIDRYLDLMNATLIFAHEKRWQLYFTGRPDEFERISAIEPFWAFRRKNYRSDYFLQGVGEVIEQNSNSVTLTTATPEAVIKFTYFNFLDSDNCQLSSFEVAPQLRFIKLSNCRVGEKITLRALGPFDRLRKGAL